jgi:hypothetical protein
VTKSLHQRYTEFMNDAGKVHGPQVMAVADAIYSGKFIMGHAAQHCVELAAQIASYSGALAGKLAAAYALTREQMDAALKLAKDAPRESDEALPSTDPKLLN